MLENVSYLWGFGILFLLFLILFLWTSDFDIMIRMKIPSFCHIKSVHSLTSCVF